VRLKKLTVLPEQLQRVVQEHVEGLCQVLFLLSTVTREMSKRRKMKDKIKRRKGKRSGEKDLRDEQFKEKGEQDNEE
jgi:hypothetical protein